MTLDAEFGVGKPTESIFQLTIADLAVGVTGTGQQPERAATLEKSFPPALKVGFPFDINIITLYGPSRNEIYHHGKRTRTRQQCFEFETS